MSDLSSKDVSRRDFISSAGYGAVGLATAGSLLSSLPAQTPGARPPNILMVMSDEHHPTWSSAHGHPAVRTPNMQKLAAMGTVFDNTYCPSPLCSPCRSAFLSGLWPHESQWYSNCNVFDRNYPTYGGVLAQQGVHTVFVGKSDIYENSSAMGFSEIFHPEDRKPPGDRTIQRNPLAIRKGAANRASQFGPMPDPFQMDIDSTQAALKWLNETSTTVKDPWTLSVELIKPHFPHYVTPELWEEYAANADLPKHGRDEPSAHHPRALDLRHHFETDKFTDDQIRNLRRGYLGCISFIDEQLGLLMDALKKTNQFDNTIIIYTSDHGDMLGKFGMWWKCSLYDDSARVPLIVAGPGFKPGTRVKTPVSLMDLQASFFHALGAKRPDHWNGSPLQEVAANDPSRVVFSEYHGHGTRASSFMVRRGDTKLMYHVNAPPQLFDLATDPEELHNLADSKPELLKDLTQELHKFCDPELENKRAEEMIVKELAALAKTPKQGGGEV